MSNNFEIVFQDEYDADEDSRYAEILMTACGVKLSFSCFTTPVLLTRIEELKDKIKEDPSISIAIEEHGEVGISVKDGSVLLSFEKVDVDVKTER
jgi:hypothetical protein